MNPYEALGMLWLIFTSALAHLAIIYGAFQWWNRSLSLAKRGEVEERRDVVEAARVRDSLTI